MGKYGDLLKKCDDRRKVIEEAKEEKERLEKIIRMAKITKSMQLLATLLKDVEIIDDIFIQYANFTNYIYITFKDTVYNLISFYGVDDYRSFLDTLSHSYNVAKYVENKALIPRPFTFNFNYKVPTLSMECGDLKETKNMSIYITWTKAMDIDNSMEIVIKRLEDGYII